MAQGRRLRGAPRLFRGPAWRAVLASITAPSPGRWTKEGRVESPPKPRGKAHDTERLIEAGFSGVVNREFIVSHTWTRDSVLGNLHSTTRFSRSVLGDELDHFENAVVGALGPDSDRFSSRDPVRLQHRMEWTEGVRSCRPWPASYIKGPMKTARARRPRQLPSLPRSPAYPPSAGRLVRSRPGTRRRRYPDAC